MMASFHSGEIAYQNLPTTADIKGLIFNVKGPLNYDISLDLSEDLLKRYEEVQQEKYHYYLHDDDAKIIHTGTVFRCHLYDIRYNSSVISFLTKEDQEICDKITNELIEIIRKNNWQVVCDISDIDKYRRLLVRITIDDIDIREYLMTNYSNYFSKYQTRARKNLYIDIKRPKSKNKRRHSDAETKTKK